MWVGMYRKMYGRKGKEEKSIGGKKYVRAEMIFLRDCLTRMKVGIAIYQSKALFKG